MEASESLRGSRSESLRTVVLEQGSDDVPAQKVEDDVDAQKASPALEDSENPQLWSDAKKVSLLYHLNRCNFFDVINLLDSK